MSGSGAVLVTGASGLVGRRVVDALAEESERSIIALDLHEPTGDARLTGVTYLTGDIRDPQLEKIFETHKVEVVVHLAAIVTPGNLSAEDEYSVDVLGTENVLRACLGAGVRQLVYASSGAAYGFHADNPVPLRETDRLRGNDEFAYAKHKRLVEERLAQARRDHPELQQLIFRPGTILGESVASPITAMFERPVIFGVVGFEIPFVLIWDEDVAAAIVKGIREERSGIYNLAGDGAVPLREIARRVDKRFVALPVVVLKTALWLAHRLGLAARGAEQADFLRYRPVLSNEKLVNEFGFKPRYTSDECLERYRALRSEKSV